MTTHLSRRQTQFSYFDHLLEKPVWKGSKILDFGGNVGGFLVGAGNQVDHADYWCLDLTKGAIEQGRSDFPRAHFVYYDRFSSCFNPDGIRYLPIPDLGLKFDIILAFSVFTHTHRNEMVSLVEQLRRMLTTQGIFAFTFSDPFYDRSQSDPTLTPGTGVLELFETPQAESLSPEISGMVETVRNSTWCVEIDEELYIEPGKALCQQELGGQLGRSYCSYFTPSYMLSLFPEATVLPPAKPEWQHCCILRSD